MHEDFQENVRQTVNFISSHLREFDALGAKDDPRTMTYNRWSPPCLGIIKANFNASVDVAHHSSVAKIILRNSEGLVMATGDALTVINKVKNLKKDHSDVWTIISNIQSLENDFESIVFKHINQQGNNAAHVLAKEDRQFSNPRIWIEDAPLAVQKASPLVDRAYGSADLLFFSLCFSPIAFTSWIGSLLVVLVVPCPSALAGGISMNYQEETYDWFLQSQIHIQIFLGIFVSVTSPRLLWLQINYSTKSGFEDLGFENWNIGGSTEAHKSYRDGNNRTKSVLVGLQGVVKKAVGLGGWHWLVLKNGVEVKLQRNALGVLEHPTGNEVDDDRDFDNSSSGSDIGDRDHDFSSGIELHRPAKPRVRHTKPWVPSASMKPTSRSAYRDVRSIIHAPQSVNLARLDTNSLRRYCKHFKLGGINAYSPREQMLDTVQQHFVAQRPLNEAQVISEFITAAKRLKTVESDTKGEQL
ncbi:hypothetical protein V6N13_046292 [Hibiscus sabdariffa]|uniref:Histone deacetylase complex subunit SAP30 Sin3 binding domain-containing protein n=1 Tax=Hibiscus sabdariffa TaxID=183260 RepID=A0ABR2D9P3_9ROSI